MRIRGAVSLLGACCFAFCLSVVACGTDNGTPDAGTPVAFDDAGNKPTVDGQAIIEKDPLPQWCGPENRPAPPLPGGTVDCPDDKNIEGCPCANVGATAPCWPGKRANRNLGACKDGVAKCVSQGEIGKVWGKCEGAVLPSGTTGKAACGCFSEGQWKIDYLSPCFASAGSSDYYAVSTQCPTSGVPPKSTPSQPWSTNSLKVDCEGHFKLCYTIKVGDVANPQPTDCAVSETVCTEADYPEKNKEQKMPDLPGWLNTNSDCVKKALVDKAALYGEMTVIGQSVFCDKIARDDKAFVFHRIPYCKIGDTSCSFNGSGVFN